VEGDRDDSQIVPVGDLPRASYDVTVAEVHAVEVADDHDRATEVVGHVVQGTPDPHEPRLASARTLDELDAEFALLPIAVAARAAFPAVELDDRQAGDVRVGRALDLELAGLTAVFAPDGEFLALYEPRDGLARAVAVFTG